MKKPQFVSMDLGTSYTLVYIEGQGVVYNEPAIVAYNTREQRIVAVGTDAYNMIGKGNRTLKVIRPMMNGVITDIKATLGQLRHIFNKLRIDKQLQGCVMLLACPSKITALEKRALEKIGLSFGASRVFIEEEAKMAALGGGINIDAPKGSLIVDMGGGTSDVAVIASGDIVLSDSIQVAGNVLNEEVLKLIRSEHGLEIGIKTAEAIKIKIGSIGRYNDENSLKVHGRDLVSGLPREIIVYPDEIRDTLRAVVVKIIDLVVTVLEKTPPELAGDIYTSGILLCGGTALLKGMDKYFSESLGLPVRIAQQPLLAVINGTKKYQSYLLDLMKREKELKALKNDETLKL
ncbi:cell shape determining protein MreB [Spiroplasma clarkii]|uniref:Cell shape-determining protein MreB n=1 Tax=Spiroplasma clarkii TaxID=2139 RepID=A0A1Y0L233_9MOLU|nr:rod shape-determining protein [Spiroplasma clarkii]ARU92033.1 cell shape determining protein MreB [Spiroplasma clarkii]ATX71364.1 cell shape determining protein MreB [Spiroplasma clarkii]